MEESTKEHILVGNYYKLSNYDFSLNPIDYENGTTGPLNRLKLSAHSYLTQIVATEGIKKNYQLT